MKDYLAAHFAKPQDVTHFGVKGMRWGVRRDRATLRAAAKKPSSEKSETKTTGEPRQVVGAASGETSSARYARLQADVKAGKSSDMSEQDLKFFNARTDALAKIEKLNQEDPSWLKTTTTKVIQQTAQSQMQNIADSLATKYIGDPIKAGLKPPAATKSLDERAKEAAVSKIDAEMLSKRTSELVDLYKKSKAPATEAAVVDTAADTVKAAAQAVSSAAKVAEASPAAGKHRATLLDRAKRSVQDASDSLAEAKRAKGDKQYIETAKKVAESERRKLSDPSEMTVSESISYYKSNPTTNPTPPAGLSPNGYRIWLDAIKRS